MNKTRMTGDLLDDSLSANFVRRGAAQIQNGGTAVLAVLAPRVGDCLDPVDHSFSHGPRTTAKRQNECSKVLCNHPVILSEFESIFRSCLYSIESSRLLFKRCSPQSLPPRPRRVLVHRSRQSFQHQSLIAAHSFGRTPRSHTGRGDRLSSRLTQR